MGVGLRNWSTTTANNASLTGSADAINWKEGQAPSTVNNSARETLSQIRSGFEDIADGWFDYGDPPGTRNGTEFSLTGTHSVTYAVGRLLRMKGGTIGTIYGVITTNSISAGNSIIGVAFSPSISLSGTLSEVALGIDNVGLASIDIDGGTEIGEAIVDADLFIADNGAGGTNRTVLASRIKTYAGTALANDANNRVVTATGAGGLNGETGLTYDGSDLTVDGDITVTGTTPTITIGDAGTEDASIVFNGNAQDFHIGLDDTADDLVIGLGSALGTTTHMAFTEDGEVTKPLNPFFNAFTSALTNVTGNNTEYTVVFANENDDVGANFNTSNGTFTAPVTGNYQFNTSLRLHGYTGNEIAVQQYWKTSNEGTKSYDEVTHDAAVTNLYDSEGGAASKGSSAAFQMDAGDTCNVVAVVNGSGSDVIDILAYSYFSGYLIS